MKSLKLISTLLGGSLMLLAQPSSIPLQALAPPVSTQLSAQTVGTGNFQPYFYWLVVNFPIGSSAPLGPVVVTNGPSPLTASNFVQISWQAVPGATNYTLIRNTIATPPASGTNNAVANNTTNTTVVNDDTGMALYTVVVPVIAANANITLNNRDQATPRLVITPGLNPSILGLPSGVTLPFVCTIGDIFYKSDNPAGQNLYGCSVANTWTLQAGGGGGAITAGPTGLLVVDTTDPTNTIIDATAFVMRTSGANVLTGSIDATGAAITAPIKTGTSLPGTCAVGDLYYKSDATAGSNLQGCTSTNVWTAQGGGSTDVPAANVAITAITATISCSSPTVQVTPNAQLILNSTPIIVAGTNGQVCEIWNLSTTNSLFLPDTSIGGATNITAKDKLAVIIPPTGAVRLRYSTSLASWIETSTSPASQFIYQQMEDFCLPTNGWTSGSFGGTGSGDGSLCSAAIEHNAVFGSGALFQLQYRNSADFPIVAKSRIQAQQAANTGFRWGVFDGNGYASPTNGIYIEKLTADTSVFGVCNSGGTSNRTALASADGAYHTYSIAKSSNTSVRFSMDGAGSTITTNCPASLVDYRQGYQFGVSDGTARVLKIDYTKVAIPR